MQSAKGKVWRLAYLLAVSASFLSATEKHWAAHEAQAIIMGTFNPYPTYLWFDGWHINGVIRVDEVLYGGPLPRKISFHFACKWKQSCQWWPIPHYPAFTFQKGLWFLRRVDHDTWESANGFSDTGFRYLSDRADWESYIRRFKQ